ncbi:MAG: ribosome small subunit-dependent GTPase A [Pseudomonadota bacterium]
MKRKQREQTPTRTTTMRVSANFGRRFALIEDSAPGVAVQARTMGKRLRPVTGDRVEANALEGEKDWVITQILDRDNTLVRPDARGRPETLAANVELIVVVACPAPAADFFIVDRYLAAARLMRAAGLLVWNKCELAPLPDDAQAYVDIGYPLVQTSTKTPSGIDALRDAISGKRSIFVGQSGVGKSSLINAICRAPIQRIGEISTASEEGKHTTVAAQLVTTPDGVALIDSPGVRDYAPSITNMADVAEGFVEIADAAARCRFANCRHRSEPGCAVKQAVADGGISERRYASYLRLAQLTRQLNTGRY